MKIRLIKKSAQESLLAVTRVDGSFTGDHLRAGGFGAIHDLTHYVVEQTLRTDQGFFGLLERGWNVRDFENKANTPLIPGDSIVIECLVGQLTNKVMRGPKVSVDDFNWLVTQAVAGVRPESAAPQLDGATFSLLLERLEDLLRRWKELPVGKTLELDFLPTKTNVTG